MKYYLFFLKTQYKCRVIDVYNVYLLTSYKHTLHTQPIYMSIFVRLNLYILKFTKSP